MSRPRTYETDAIRVQYDAKRCIHAAECVHGLPAVFEPGRRPWIDPKGAPADELAAVIRRCPTGALQYKRLDGQDAETATGRNALVDSPDGPIYANGAIEIRSSTGALIAHELRAALCRCGASANKPYCDGAHAKVGFEDAGEVVDLKLKPVDAAQGPIVVTVREDGPLLISGPFELYAANLASDVVGGGCALCRCGASVNKPFCDGTHKVVGFTDSGQGPAPD